MSAAGGGRVLADQDVCVGAGQCARVAPGVFDQADDGLVVLLVRDVPAGEVDAVLDAVDRCPSGAVRLGAPAGGPY
ncbi:ferredoxin [Cellulomonas phragmiteti]|uniref:ferredoxin n=1 Tax=Cellulomonas phragmiteti TaxID=478780 RepID=UPI00194311C2|nr:ferredoxin [Cellulomonas phragmiteti]